MPRRALLSDLRDLLAYLYPTEGDARRIIFDSYAQNESGAERLDVTGNIDFHGPARHFWHNILLDAARQQAVARLLATVLAEYPTNAELQQLEKRLRQAEATGVALIEAVGEDLLQVPFQAPKPVPQFVGREELIKELQIKLAQARDNPIIGLVGMGGVGKTAVAIQIAHAACDLFPDGLLWADLAASTVEAELVSFAAAYGRAEAVGEQLDLANKAELVRNILADKQLLIVIDNAQSSADVEHLVAGGPGSCRLITTRNRRLLANVDATIVDVVPFSEAEALALLAAAVGDDRVQAEREAAVDIIHRVDCLPLALSIIASYLNEASELTLAQYDELLQDGRTGLAMLADWENTERNVQTTFELSYRRLPEVSQRLFASLAVFGGPDFGSQAVAAINQTPLPSVILDLGRLYALSLVQMGLGARESLIPLSVKTQPRYRLHALVKAFALTKAQTDAAMWQRSLALYYLDMAEKNQEPQGYKLLDLEWQNILSTLHWSYEQSESQLVVRGALSLTHNNLGQMGYMDVRGHWSEARQLLTWAYNSLNQCADPLARIRVLTNIGGFAVRQADFQVAQGHLQAALRLLEQQANTSDVLLQRLQIYDFMARSLFGSDPPTCRWWLERGITESDANESDTIRHYRGLLRSRLSAILARMGKLNEAIAAGEDALALLPPEPSSAKVGALLNLGIAYQHVAQSRRSAECFQQGLLLAEEMGDLARLAAFWTNLGWIAKGGGHLAKSIEYQQRALGVYRYMGDVYHMAGVSLNIGSTYTRLGEHQQAIEYLQNSLTLCQKHGLTDIEAMTASNLAEINLQELRMNEANELLAKAHKICLDLNMGYLLPTVLRQQAELALAQERFQESLALIEQSIQLTQKDQDAEEEGIGWRVKGSVLHALGKSAAAIDAWHTSLAILTDKDPYELARTKVTIAQQALANETVVSSAEQAKGWLGEALTTFAALGAVREAQRAQWLIECDVQARTNHAVPNAKSS